MYLSKKNVSTDTDALKTAWKVKRFAMSPRSAALPTDYKNIQWITFTSVNIQLEHLWVYNVRSRNNSKTAKHTHSSFYEYDGQQT